MASLVLLLLLSCSALGGFARDFPEVTPPTFTTTTPSSSTRPVAEPTVVKTASSSNGFSVSAQGLSKRDVKIADLSKSPASGKSFDPPPEFYRGPGSTSHRVPSAFSHTITKPIIFPDTKERNKYSGGGGRPQDDRYLSNAYEEWKLQRRPSGGSRHPSVDRISVGHYGSPDHGLGGGGGGGGGVGGGAGLGSYTSSYAYDGHGLDYGGHGSSHYGASAHGGSGHGGLGQGGLGHVGSGHVGSGHVGGSSGGGGGGGGSHLVYYASGGGGSGHGGGGGVVESGGIPFDVYGHGGHKGHYAGSGGEYSYTTYPEGHEQGSAVAASHKGHPDFSHKALLAKSFLIPLASAAVLGIAAALVSNPLLLQLGTVSGVGPAVVGKRRRRRAAGGGVDEDQEEEKEEQKQSLAYRGQRRVHV